MQGEPLRLRNRRATRSPRRASRARAFGVVLVVGLVAGAACWAPYAPTALAPLASGGLSALAPAAPDPPPPAAALDSLPAAPPASVPVAPVVAVQPAAPTAVPKTGPALPLAVPTVAPQPTPIPPLSPDGAALIASVKSDRESQWLKNHAETPLRAGPSDDAPMFTMLPQWTTLKQLESRPGWMLVYYRGDGDTRQPGPGWIKASDAGGIDAPAVWLRNARPTAVFAAADAGARAVMEVSSSALMEVVGAQYTQGQRVRVRLPGDGRSVPPAEGWVEANSLQRAGTPNWHELPVAYPEVLTADVRLKVPYRTQLDGSGYASANCGPTTLGMALEALGVNLPQPLLRSDVLVSGDLNPDDDDAGTWIWALARVAESNGVRALGLYEDDGQTLRRWSIDDVRANVRAGRPVIAQVVYRGLPGREDSNYYGDHYVVITGLLGEDFLYNDPIGGVAADEPPGWDRIMTATQLRRAMRASDTPYAFTAFSVSR